MYGVRIMDGRRIADLKIFRSLDSAREWLNDHDHGNFDRASIYEVPGAVGVRDAADAIRGDDASRSILIETQESEAATQARLTRERAKVDKKRRSHQARILDQAEEFRCMMLKQASGRPVTKRSASDA